MYEAVKKYETYMARNKRLEGQSSSPSTRQQKTAGQTSNYKPRFHKTTAFTAKVEESEAQVDQRQEAQPTEEGNPSEAESSLDDDDGLYIPSYLEEAAPNDPVLQVRLARAMRALEKETRRCYRCNQQGHLQKDCKEPEEKKRSRAPLVEGASFSQIGAGEDQAENPSARSSRASNKPLQVKGTPYLNPDPFCRFIGPKNWGEALIDDKLTTCLLDNGSQLNFVTPAYAHERGMDILSLDTLAQEIGGQLPPIAVMGGGMIKPEGFVIMNVWVPCVRGYNEDQIAIVLEDPEMKDCPVVLGTSTLFRVMEVIKESEISELAVPWANSRLSWLMRGVHAKMSRLQVKDVANKPIAPLSVDEVVRATSKCMVPPFGHKVIHGRVGLVLQGYKMNVMTHGLEKRSPLLPLGLEVQSAYATLATGSSRVPVVLRNNTKDWLEIKKGTPIARMVAANLVPRVINAVPAKGPHPTSTLMEAE